jgi:outer membrane cobalamin receptor
MVACGTGTLSTSLALRAAALAGMAAVAVSLLAGISILGSIALAPAPARAQAYWPGVVDTVQVRARRYDPREDWSRRSGFATVIPLGLEAPAGRDLADLLDRTAGVQVHRYGGLGSFSQAGVRGSAPGQVLVCVDGVPVASAGDGYVDLALLPVSLFGHAEILRGAQTTGFGGPPAAGVINLVTPAALVAPLRLTTGGGSFGTAYARGLWGAERGPGSVYVAAQARRSRGDFEYLDRNGTYFGNTADDRTVSRRNNDFEDRAFLGKGTLRWPRGAGAGSSVRVRDARADERGAGETSDAGGGGGKGAGHRAGTGGVRGTDDARGNELAATSGDRTSALLRSLRLDYTAQLFARDGGVPGTENVQTRETRFRTERARHEVAGSGIIPWHIPARFEAAWHRERIRDRFENPAGEVGLSRTRTDNRTFDRGGRAEARLALTPLKQDVRVAWQGRTEEWTPRDLLRGTTGFTRARRHRATSLEDRLRIGRFTAEAAYHWAKTRDNYAGSTGWGQPAGPSPARTLRYEGPVFGLRADCGAGLLLKANRGRTSRFPSFPELFGQNGVQEGNPTLRSETGLQWDAGLAWSPELPLRLESAYFESVTENKITLLQNSQRTVKAMNLDRAWVRGVETSLFARRDLTPRASLELQSSFTWQRARDVGRSPTYRGKDLPNLPDREAHAALQARRDPWEARWDLSARSEHYRDRYNSATKRTPSSVVHGATVERALFRRALLLRAEIQNIFDRRIEDIDGFPLPGRSFLAEITWTR